MYKQSMCLVKMTVYFLVLEITLVTHGGHAGEMWVG